jgi:hypothetical protein
MRRDILANSNAFDPLVPQSSSVLFTASQLQCCVVRRFCQELQCQQAGSFQTMQLWLSESIQHPCMSLLRIHILNIASELCFGGVVAVHCSARS